MQIWHLHGLPSPGLLIDFLTVHVGFREWAALSGFAPSSKSSSILVFPVLLFFNSSLRYTEVAIRIFSNIQNVISFFLKSKVVFLR